tara:strand:- start:153 stop:653 length:501 start_codon:yes stop_codon:yes gene_type:complete
MKLTKSQLKRIIKEELSAVLKERIAPQPIKQAVPQQTQKQAVPQQTQKQAAPQQTQKQAAPQQTQKQGPAQTQKRAASPVSLDAALKTANALSLSWAQEGRGSADKAFMALQNIIAILDIWKENSGNPNVVGRVIKSPKLGGLKGLRVAGILNNQIQALLASAKKQ